MIVKEKGQVYTLQTASGYDVIDIIFCRKDESGKWQDGITSEELMNILENRMTSMVEKKPTTENMNALTHIRQSKMWIHARNYKKISNNKNKKYEKRQGNGIQLQAEGGQTG